MNVFELHGRLIEDYRLYVESFIRIKDERIKALVEEEIDRGLLWPQPLVQLSPSFEPGGTIDELVAEGLLHPECSRIFRVRKDEDAVGRPMTLHRHQVEAIRAAAAGDDYVLTTGTGSGKSLAYLIPIVDRVLRERAGSSDKRIRAIVVYPMNALANSQAGELRKFLCDGYPDGKGPVTFRRYTGQESDQERNDIVADPPDILLTNYVMLELILSRPREEGLINAAQGLRFLVLDELHTYRGRQGADVAFLVRRVRNRLAPQGLQVVGTSATLAAPGSYEEQRAEVARVASQLFGAPVKPERVIGETLRRATEPADLSDPEFVAALRQSLDSPEVEVPTRYQEFVKHPLARWLESVLGVEAEPSSGRLVRTQPKSITGENGVARTLSQLTGVPEEICQDRIAEFLMGATRCERDPATGFPPLAFRLHQFIGRGDTVYATLEPEDRRRLTTQAQRFATPGKDTVLLPLAFCRECGQEYYVVSEVQDEAGNRVFVPRSLSERVSEGDSSAGFLYLSTTEPWPQDAEALLDRLPEDWVETGDGWRQVRKAQHKKLPRTVTVSIDGRILTSEPPSSDQSVTCQFVPAPFSFCLSCGVSYAGRTMDFAKLGQLGSEGRSTATTILGLSTVLGLRQDPNLEPRAKKLLSFTDNRQDASLQAGHFNDFVEVGLLRSALYRAVAEAGEAGIRHDELTQRVFEALELPLDQYAVDPTVKYGALQNTQEALRSVLGYRLYQDLQKGWRITLPNLEQCGLLKIEYQSLEELAAEDSEWQDAHPALATATRDTRAAVAKTLLDWMRRGLAIKVDYLRATWQESLRQKSSQHLRPPWAIDEQEKLRTASVVFPRPRRVEDSGGNLFVSGRGGFGQYLRRPNTFPRLGARLSIDDANRIIRELFEILRRAGLVEVVESKHGDVPGYQVPASAMVWKAGDGTTPYYDPIRVPSLPAGGGRTNEFFASFYRTTARNLVGIEAREHTAQVAYEARQEREQRFREGRLPLLFCSPTMELGVDIAELNVVNLRNVPPNPANYAQRSGRAGRSGQPALIYSYCSVGSPHDQYFFKRPELMVAGAVSPPRLDLANKDLIRAHVQAIWLAETDLSLGKSLRDILDLSGDEPTLALQQHVREAIEAEKPRERARARATAVLADCQRELEASGWYGERWLDEVLDKIHLRFDRACDRWRDLYRGALAQFKAQNAVISDPTRTEADKRAARRLRGEAEQQLSLLTDVDNLLQSDFYSYRYFASEGFLPGYSFPRLPISAFIPGKGGAGQGSKREEEFIQRPRFLAISEFGPRAIIYHEGSHYVINKAILPAREGEELALTRAKICPQCGYLHRFEAGDGPDLCQSCGAFLPPALTNLFRLQNVSTSRRDRISSDEEERMRLGYELMTAVCLEHDGVRLQRCTAEIKTPDGETLAKLTYGHAALLWRINKGWARRQDRAQLGFLLDVERGYWARNQDEDADDYDQVPRAARTARVIPFVEDRRNCLLIDMARSLTSSENASLRAALKRGIQACYQLEDEELAVEPLPSDEEPRRILMYEAAEGGAGVLRQLLYPGALAAVAREALSICHFDPETGEDKRRPPRAREDCQAACYDCLLSYQNQRHHQLLDRHSVRELLLMLRVAQVETSPSGLSRAEHLQRLKELAGSELERAWLELLESYKLRLPSHAQYLIPECGTRPDFLYEDQQLAVYIDGPPHDYPGRQERDAAQTIAMEDYGYTVVRFHHKDDWLAVIDRYPHVFGRVARGQVTTGQVTTGRGAQSAGAGGDR